MARLAAPANAAYDRIVTCILERTEPELILLFGSRAAGGAHEDSDYDLLLVVRDGAVAESARRAARDALTSQRISADVLATSVEQYERRQSDPGFLEYMVAREGRLLYTTGAVPQRTSATRRVREGQSQEGLAMWIRRADSDLRAAESLLAALEPSWDAVVFHSHGCVEKLLKALIVRAGIFPPRTHDLNELLALQPAAVRAESAIDAACRLLMDLHPKARYPLTPEPSVDEARQAIAAAREVRRVLRPHLEG